MSQATQPTGPLQPPGAGLPAYELAWLRVFMHLAYGLTPQEAALGWFKREAENILALACGIPAEQGGVPVLIDRIPGIEDSSRNWSVFMVLDHLRIVNTGVSRILETLQHDRPFTTVIRIQDVKPRQDAGPETIGQFVQAASDYEATIRRLGKLGKRPSHPHPWFGPMAAHDWHVFAGIHQWLHRRQIACIAKRMGHGEM